MADYPIIFSGPMVQALLEGRKTQTRRIPTAMWEKVRPGDRLWVREAWTKAVPLMGSERIIYRADDGTPRCIGTLWDSESWKPSIHMPRWASRIILEVTATKREPLQDISEADAEAEGVEGELCDAGPRHGPDGRMISYIWSLMGVWQHLHQKPGRRWQDNPEVIALTFNVRLGNIDEAGDG